MTRWKRIVVFLSTEAAVFALVCVHLVLGALLLIQPPVLAAYALLRLVKIRYRLRLAAIGYFLAIGVWQLYLSRMALAVSASGWTLIAVGALGHAWLRRKRPQAKWAVLTMLATPLAAAIVGVTTGKLLLLLLAATAAGALFFLPACTEKLSIPATSLFAFAVGWMALFGSYYYQDLPAACTKLTPAQREIFLQSEPPAPELPSLYPLPVNLVAPACAPGKYLIASRRHGLYYLEKDETPNRLTYLADGQVFGFPLDCGRERALGVTWEKNNLVRFDLRERQTSGELALAPTHPDAVIELPDALAVATGHGTDIQLVSRDGERLLRTLRDVGKRVLAYDAQQNRLLSMLEWNLTAINAATGEIMKSKPLASWEARFALDVPHRRLYVLGFFTGLLYELDLDSLETLRLKFAPIGSRYLVYNPHDGCLYLSNFLGGTIVQMDARSLTTVRTIPVGPQPRRLNLTTENGRDYLLVGAGCGAVRLPLGTVDESKDGE
ncbi:MAG TPA: hypothetical protein PK961_07780 [bacterium]|nr:hypothetical protein [bacterium]